MTPRQEMVLTLFDKEVIEQAKKLSKSSINIYQVDKYNMPFRLFKVNELTINLELCIRRLYGPVQVNAAGVKIRNGVMFFKPIGIYSIGNNIFSNSLKITILKEFEKDYNQLVSTNQVNSNNEVKKMSLIENAVIAAFSMDAIVEARAMEDVIFTGNGIDFELIISNKGYPQSFPDDSYGIKGPIGAYFISGPNSINPLLEYKTLFDDFSKRSLLSAFKTS